MSNKNLKNKYNFNITEQERDIRDFLTKYNPFKRFDYRIPLLEKYKTLELQIINKPLTFEDKLEMRKIQYDSLTSSEILKKKVILNYRLLKIFFDNFYSDDFNKTRQGVYLLFTVPFVVGGGFYILSPVHPIRGLAFNLSILVMIANLWINYLSEIDEVLMQDSEVAEEVYIVKFR
jgi:hypothetical protein